MPTNDDWPNKPIGAVVFPGNEVPGEGGVERLLGAVKAMHDNDEKVRLRDEVDPARWQDSVASSLYAVARTRAELNELLHFGHPIPILSGRTQQYIDKRYPGWTWNRLTAVLKAAGVFEHGGAGTPHCDPRVGAVHFDNEHTWMVEWENGRVTVSRAPDDAESAR